MWKINHIKMLAEDDFEGAAIWAEINIQSVANFMSTWGSHCGAPRSVFLGHIVKMLIDIDAPAMGEEIG